MDLYPFVAGPSANVLGFFFESSDIGNVDNCLVNDNNGDTASSENGQAVDIIIDDVNSDSQASNSSFDNHSTASMNDNSTNNNITCDISHTSNVNSRKDDNNVSSNSNSSDAINNCSDSMKEMLYAVRCLRPLQYLTQAWLVRPAVLIGFNNHIYHAV